MRRKGDTGMRAGAETETERDTDVIVEQGVLSNMSGLLSVTPLYSQMESRKPIPPPSLSRSNTDLCKSDYIAGPVMCSTSTVYSSIKESGLRPGQWAVFPGGGGGVGIQGVQIAVAMGIRPIVVDTGAERKKMCLDLGAEVFLDFATDDHVAEVVKITGGGAHAVFVTAVQSYPIALNYLGYRVGGQIMCIGLPPKGKYHIDLDPTQLVFRKQSLKGTLVAGMADVDEALDFAARGKLKFKPTVVGLSKFNESIQKLKNGQVAGRIVVDFNLE
jgi:propanol-preferring alcohol dehydrogenase